MRQPGDGWVDCACGRRHWGLHGAAGLFLVRRDASGEATHVVLQHRSLTSHQGGMWGIPGGARMPGESAAEAALREAREEAGIPPGAVRLLGEHVLDHRSWSYTTVLAEQRPGTTVDVRVADSESIEVAWVDAASVQARPLLPAFAQAWPTLLAETRLAPTTTSEAEHDEPVAE